MSSILAIADPPIDYPEDNGEPLADNTVQFRWITMIQGELDSLFAADPLVLVVGDLLWYPVKGDNSLSQAPDVMVVFGRPKHDRLSYKQWEEEDIPPAVVFEILSHSNRPGRMELKFANYEQYGVEEYYLYDPQRNELHGYLRHHDRLVEIPQMHGWVSPRLKIRFDHGGEELRLFRPDGQPFATYLEVKQQTVQARQIAEEERLRADQQQALVKALADKLRALGVDPGV